MKLALSIPGFGKIDSGLSVPTGGLFDRGQNLLLVAIQVAVLGALLFSVYTMIRGGINMITSGGDKQKFQAGRERVRYAIIGLVIVFMSIFIVTFLGTAFGVNLLNIFK